MFLIKCGMETEFFLPKNLLKYKILIDRRQTKLCFRVSKETLVLILVYEEMFGLLF